MNSDYINKLQDIFCFVVKRAWNCWSWQNLLIYLMVAKYSPWYSARDLTVRVSPRLFGNTWCVSHMPLEGNPRTYDRRARLEMELSVWQYFYVLIFKHDFVKPIFHYFTFFESSFFTNNLGMNIFVARSSCMPSTDKIFL